MVASAPLSELCEQVVDCPHSTPVWTESGFFVLRSHNIRNGRLDLSEPSFTDEAHYLDRTRRATPTEGDLVITREAPMGEVCMIPPALRCCLGQRMVLLRPDRSKVDPRFLLYALQSEVVQHEILVNEGTGSTVSNLRIPVLETLPIPCLPLSEQRAIAHILGTLDDKIALNRRMNETLEAITRALFKSWFVDFDPVRAKAEGRTPWGMDAETAKLFPSEFVESESKPLPKGWRYGSIGEFVELQRGTTYKSALKDLPGPMLLGLGAIQRNGGFRDDKLSTYGGDSPEKLLVYPGELFASLKDVTQSADLLGAVARVPRHVAGGRLTQDTVKLLLTGTIDIGEVVYRTLLTDEYREYCRQHATGTTNLGLSREDFLSYPIVVAAAPVLDAFNRSIRSLSSREEVAVMESRTLGRIRDELLPRLLSGELSVAHAEREVEAVA